jgi:type II secretory pathway pseudopilin PulG
MVDRSPARGFTMVETLIATGVLVTAIAGLAQLFLLSVRFTRDSGQFGVALVAAQDKLESLRSLTLGYGDDGAEATDARLRGSPPESLAENTDGFADWLDAAGNIAPERGAAYVRRWRITPLDADEPTALAIEVCVFEAATAARELSDAEACLATVRVRQP